MSTRSFNLMRKFFLDSHPEYDIHEEIIDKNDPSLGKSWIIKKESLVQRKAAALAKSKPKKRKYISEPTPKSNALVRSSYHRKTIAKPVTPSWEIDSPLFVSSRFAADRPFYYGDVDSKTSSSYDNSLQHEKSAQQTLKPILPDDEVYLEKVQQILTGPPFIGVPPEPTDIYLNVYLGTQANAENMDLLRRMRFTHVLNCAGVPSSLRQSRAKRYKDTNIRYEELALDDSEFACLARFWTRAHTFIDQGQIYGKVLIHCTGVSRSGAIAISYLIRYGGQRLLEAVKTVKEARRVALCNNAFMKQLVDYAREMRMLDMDPSWVKTPKYGRALDRRRILSSHLPIDL